VHALQSTRWVAGAFARVGRRKLLVAGIAVPLVIGVGIGAALINVALGLTGPAPLVEDPSALVTVVRHSPQGGPQPRFDYQSYLQIRDYSSLTRTAAHAVTTASVAIDGSTERTRVALVSDTFADTVGVRSALGSAWGREDSTADGAQSVVVSYHFYSRYLGASDQALGREVRIDGHPFHVGAVLPRGFVGLDVGSPVDLWLPLSAQPLLIPEADLLRQQAGANWLFVIGRINDDRARSLDAVSSVMRRSGVLDPEDRLVLWPAASGLRVGASGALSGLVGIAIGCALVLAVVIMNVSSAMIAEVEKRRYEFAVRRALGASRRQALQDFAWDIAVIAIMTGTVAWVVSLWSARGLVASLPELDAAQWKPALGLLAFLLTLALSILCASLSYRLAATTVRDADIAAVMTDAMNVHGTNPDRRSWRAVLAVGEVAFAVLVAIASVLFARTANNLKHASIGFDPRGVVFARVSTTNEPAEAGRAFYAGLIARLRDQPGIVAVSALANVPIGEGHMTTMIRTVEAASPVRASPVGYNVVWTDFLKTMGIKLVAGRDFDSTDSASSEPVVVVSRTTADGVWGQRDAAVGKLITVTGGGPPRVARVIGVADDARYLTIQDAAGPYIYLCGTQFDLPRPTIAIKSVTSDAGAVSRIRSVLTQYPGVSAVLEVRGFADHLSRWLRPATRFAAILLALAGVSVALAIHGVFAFMSNAVVRRSREVAIRMMLGATSASIARTVLGWSMRLTAVGILIGCFAGFAAATLLRRALYGVEASDVVTFVGVSAVLLVASAAASAWPLILAARTHPSALLRQN
jgi:predicted permease